MVGAAVGLGAGAGAWVGGASVGLGAGWETVLLAGCVPWVLLADLTDAAGDAVAVGVGFPLADGVLAEEDPLPVVCPAEDCVDADVVAP